MKLILNIYFEKLHRFVYDKHYQSKSPYNGLPTKHRSANRHNILKAYNQKIANFYTFISPYFEGWRDSLVGNYPDKAKYERYK